MAPGPVPSAAVLPLTLLYAVVAGSRAGGPGAPRIALAEAGQAHRGAAQELQQQQQQRRAGGGHGRGLELPSEEQTRRSPSHSAEDRCATGWATAALVPTAFLNAAEDGSPIRTMKNRRLLPSSSCLLQPVSEKKELTHRKSCPADLQEQLGLKSPGTQEPRKQRAKEPKS